MSSLRDRAEVGRGLALTKIEVLERRLGHLRSRSKPNSWDRREISALIWALPKLREMSGLPASRLDLSTDGESSDRVSARRGEGR